MSPGGATLVCACCGSKEWVLADGGSPPYVVGEPPLSVVACTACGFLLYLTLVGDERLIADKRMKP